MGGVPTTQTYLISEEESDYWKCRIRYNRRWHGMVVSIFKRIFGEAHNGPQMGKCCAGGTAQGGPLVQQVEG